ncbi:AfsR/SARP family transcriptional regulator [Microlunatus speluncae]|uniref:AfsR/SARP family transcriptional regulator n=1 Tax=Microlunatus speluncae TaxID=2594267 RepID=UPI0012663383|nr:BTAD domain-containing putative transcriptional regulator [Microlunatus speluncae]
MQYALAVLDGVRWQGEPVPGIRPQTLLAALVRGGGGAVGDGLLIEEIWGDEPPADATKALQVLVSRTRAACSAELITRGQAGYRLGVAAGAVDVLALADAVVRARAALVGGATAAALQLAEEALRIPVQDADPAQPESLNLLRAAARRHRAELAAVLGQAQSRGGDHAAAVATLTPLIDAVAVDGGMDEQVLAALLRSEAAARGPGPALERYESYRRDLADRLGTDPGPELQRVQSHLLALDRPVREGLHFDPTRLIGRDDDVRAVLGLLGTGPAGAGSVEHRVVSILGPGGLGKTRLAHAVGRAASQPVVHLVELVGIAGDDEVIIEVASALGVRDSVATWRALTPEQRTDLRSRLSQKLAGAPTLLIIDNCEHVIDGVARLVSLLITNLPELSVLTTTRAPLGIAAERAYPLAQLSRSDGVALFRERASAARPDALLDDAAIGALVERLDGLPLAVELAAAKIRVMSVVEIAVRLTDRFGLLRSRDPAAPDRHRTLEAVIDWSANLLDEDGRTALRRLASFRDGFGLDGAGALIGGDSLGRDVVLLLEELADQSLITVEEGSTIRYRMLETVREYGLLQQGRVGESETVARAFRAWAVALCRDLFETLFSTEQYATVDQLAIEEGNLNEALRQAITDGDADAVVVIMAAMGGFWWILGDHQRIVGMLGGVQGLLEGYDPPPHLADAARATVASLLTNSVIFYADDSVDVSMDLLKRLGPGEGNPKVAAQCRNVLLLGLDLTVQDRIHRLVEATRSDDRDLALQASHWLCHLAENEGDPQTAIAAGEAGLRIWRPSDGPWLRAVLLNALAELHLQLGDWRSGERFAAEALPIMERLHASDDTGHLRGLLVMTAIWGGRLDHAADLLAELREQQSRSLLQGGDTVVATADAELAFARGDIPAGLDEYRRALPRMREFRIPGYGSPEHAPWLLFTESAALCAYHRYGADDEADALYDALLGKLHRYLDPPGGFTDYPVVGTVLFALGARRSVDRPDLAARLLAYAQAFTVVRTLPSTNAEAVVETVERQRPGLLAKLEADLAGRMPRDLRDQVGDLITEINAERKA